MITHLLKTYSNRFLSRWIVLAFDISTVTFAYLLACLVRFNFNFESIDITAIKSQIGIVILVYLLAFLLMRSFSGIIRHTGLIDAFNIFRTSGYAFLFLLSVNILFSQMELHSDYIVPLSILVIHFLLVILFLFGSRIVIKRMYTLALQTSKQKIPVIIYGAGSAGMLAKNALQQDNLIHYEIVAFIDDNPSKVRKSLEGIPVLSQKWVLNESFVKHQAVQQLIIAIQDLKPARKKKVVEAALNLHLKVKQVPSINSWINGKLSSQQFRQIKIEELLERVTIRLDSKNVNAYLKNNVIFITGAAGSIGSEIARQVLNYSPKRIILIDQAETPIYELKYSISNNEEFAELNNRIEYVIANVKDSLRMDRIMELYRPDIIYHAAAYKHVPLMEENPYEAVLMNIYGTKSLADLAVKYKVERFVMISTDKAVNPTNIMGASKRIAEIYTQSLNNDSTRFVITRFGNVLGSNGSVVPLFRKQIEQGGPLTLTHKDITRYFMTVPEACNLVLEAGAMGDEGDIFVFDMGKPVKIFDLAHKMIQLYGLDLGKDIDIVETGLRPGEKLFEELLTDSEKTLPTHHPKIMRAKVQPMSKKYVESLINELSELIVEGDEFALVEKMKQIVPEFISNNSVYE
ncbi:MAG: nucleoside-diphosphate sugar epimerase/dehydratase, partial [Bacteroidales bacterium]|nr:nucleoside-diphosphate sugar epimerase/dehydratase [Bacteroidales bacterium]